MFQYRGMKLRIEGGEEDFQPDGILAAEAMIEILKRQGPIAWHKFITDYCNWDCAGEVMDWIIAQDECDVATAAAIIWDHELFYFVDNDIDMFSEPILSTIIYRYEKGFYRHQNIEMLPSYYMRSVQSYLKSVEKHPTAINQMPPVFFGLFEGQKAVFDPEWRPEINSFTSTVIFWCGTSSSGFAPRSLTPEEIEYEEYFRNFKYTVTEDSD